jgi:hypothetical protein
MATVKAFRLIPFNKEKQEIPLKTSMFYVDIEENQEYWKDVVIASSKDKVKLEEFQKDIAQFKNHPKFAKKFMIFNWYENDDDKIEFFVLKELEGTVNQTQ